MKLIFLHGKPGVGKLTVARALEGITGYRVFHNHQTVDLVCAVFDFGTPSFVELRERIWLEVLREATRNDVNLIFTFAFEPSVRRSFIETVRTTVESEGGEVLFVKLTCSEEQLEKRVVNESRKSFGKLSDLEQFRQLNEAGTFDEPGTTEDRLVVDTTNFSADAVARKIAVELNLIG